MIPYEDLHTVNEPYIKELRACFDDVLSRGRFILDDQAAQFEKEFADYCGSTFGVGVGNGSDALTLILKSHGWPANAEVIVPSNTHIATVLAVLNAGLRPVLAEPDVRTYNLDPGKIAETITANTVAIIAVHLYGKCAPMPGLLKLASQRGLVVLEDCAQAHGASINERKAGTWGTAAAFSFYPTKNLGALGDGGFVTSQSRELSDRIRALRNYGSLQKNVHEFLGVNSRLDELQAAFLRVKLAHLDDVNSYRRNLAAIYDNILTSDFIRPVIQEGYYDVYHIYAVRHPERDRLRTYLEKNGVETMIHYPIPLHRQKALQGKWPGQDFPLADELSRTLISLPISAAHTPEQIHDVARLLNSF